MDSRRLRACAALLVTVVTAACGGGGSNDAPPAAASASSAPAASTAVTGMAKADDPCPLTVDQVAIVTGAPMTHPPGGCTFFPANGRDIPHVFFVLQVPLMCSSIQPNEVGFNEKLEGLSASSAYVRDQIDGTHVLVCRNNSRAFDVVVDIKGDKAANRAAAIELAKQVLEH